MRKLAGCCGLVVQLIVLCASQVSVAAQEQARLQCILEMPIEDYGNIPPDETVEKCTSALKDASSKEKAFNIYFARATAYLRLEKVKQAMDDYDQCLLLRPNDSSIVCARALCLWIQGFRDKGVSEVRQALRRHPTYPPAHVLAAVMFLAQRDLAAGFRHADRAVTLLRAQPDLEGQTFGGNAGCCTLAKAYYYRSIALMAQEKPEEALRDISQSIELMPLSILRNGEVDASSYQLRARLLLMLDRPTQALQDCIMARQLEPDSLATMSALCNSYYYQEKYALTHLIAEKMAARFQDSSHGYSWVAASLAKQGHYREAVRAAEHALSRTSDQERPRVLRQLASIQALRRDYRAALQLLDKAMALEPKSASAAKLKILLLASCPDKTCRDLEKALQLARQLCQDRNTDSEARLLLAVCYAESGSFVKAVDSTKKAIALVKHYLPRKNADFQHFLKLFEEKKVYKIDINCFFLNPLPS